MIRIRCLITSVTLTLLLIALCLLIVQPAFATTTVASDGGVQWCEGDGSAYNTAYPILPTGITNPPPTDNLPAGVLTPDGLAANPASAFDSWMTNPILENPVGMG